MLPRPGGDDPDRGQDLHERLTSFMAWHVYPNEATYREQIREDRWRPPRSLWN